MHRLLLLLPLAAFAGVADHPDVTAAERLFESWIRGQMAYRGLPGIARLAFADGSLRYSSDIGVLVYIGHAVYLPDGRQQRVALALGLLRSGKQRRVG